MKDLNHPVLQALVATLFTWGLTLLGASLVFFFKRHNQKFLDTSLGFTGGVMIAASFWSLLAPSIAYTESQIARGEGSLPTWFPVASGVLLGALFLFMLDKLIPHLHINFKREEAEGPKTNWEKTILLVLAITLHNIPEGLAVGVAFGAVYHGVPGFTLGAAVALAIGIGIQNFPEGFAVSMPLKRQGVSRLKSFWWGQLSAVVEPVSGIIGAAAVMSMLPILPYALAFAAGAMIYIVVEEVIPESQRSGYVDQATLGFIAGFVIMMILDVSLG